MLRLYFLMTCEMRRTIPPVIHEATIRGLADVPENCGTEYRFRTRSHLKRVMDCCRFPSMVTLDNGQPVLLPPGIHVWTSESLKFLKAVAAQDLNDKISTTTRSSSGRTRS